MSQKFSIVIEVRDGKPVTTGYLKADAQKANEHFLRLRNEEKEAYLFQHPLADRRSKSAAQVTATLGNRDAEGKPTSVPSVTVKTDIKATAKKKVSGNKIEGVSLDAVDLS